MSYRDATFLALGWNLAVGVRLVVDFIFTYTDERKRRRARAVLRDQ